MGESEYLKFVAILSYFRVQKRVFVGSYLMEASEKYGPHGLEFIRVDILGDEFMAFGRNLPFDKKSMTVETLFSLNEEIRKAIRKSSFMAFYPAKKEDQTDDSEDFLLVRMKNASGEKYNMSPSNGWIPESILKNK